MQKAYITALYELMQNDKNVISVLTDSGTDYDELLKREFPNQCLNFGIAEGNSVGAAAGLASCGKIPYVYTTSAFLAYRSLEFIRDDICFQNQNVKIVGMGSGTSWCTLGPSHHTTEDISVLRALPNLTILSPASPNEVKKVVDAAYKIKGPVYIRMGMSNEKEIYDSDYEFIVGKSICIKEGTDVTIFTTGSIIEEVIKATGILEEKGISTRVVNAHTIKPFDSESVINAAKRTKYIFTVEEHNIYGGLGACVAEVIAEANLNVNFKRIGLNDCFAKGYGNQFEVRQINKLDGEGLFKTIHSKYTERV